MRSTAFETFVGIVVLGVAISFFAFVYQKTNFSHKESYILSAQFDRIDGLKAGADVRISGVKVGTVIDQKINTSDFRAVVRFNVRKDIKLSTDSSAEIHSDGLLGGKYLQLVPGGEEAQLAANEEVQHTQSSVSLEEMIGQMIYSKKKEN